MLVNIIAHPNSKKPRVEKDMLGDLHIYVSEPALEGKANRALIEALADHFGVKKNQVLLVSGERSKSKTFNILERS